MAERRKVKGGTLSTKLFLIASKQRGYIGGCNENAIREMNENMENFRLSHVMARNGIYENLNDL